MSDTFEDDGGGMPEQEAMGICFPEDSNTTQVQGFIGGEAHNSYLLHLLKGRKLTLQITSTENRASFSVETEEFGDGVDFGTSSDEGRTWVGVIPRTGVYFISVVSYPESDYTITVTVE